MADFTHFQQDGRPKMVDVSPKAPTLRTARASGRVLVSRDTLELIRSGGIRKGDVLGCAQIAGIMAAKRTADLIPLCHRLNLTKAEVSFELDEEGCAVLVRCTAGCTGPTGVEMEALTGVSAAMLTIYDMCKAADRGMVMDGIRLLEKSGGKSGHFHADGSHA